MAVKGLLAIARANNAALAIVEVTVQGWQHRETVDGETFRQRYFTERERDIMVALISIVEVLTPDEPTDALLARINTARVLIVRAIDKLTLE